MPAIPLEKLREWSPFEHIVWSGIAGNFVGQGNGPITREEVRLAIEEGRLRARPVDGRDLIQDGVPIRRDHVERIAYLVVHPDPTPIDFDVGVPSLGCHVDWPLQDGHHRLAAAFYRGDATIEADISGCLDTGEEMFGVKVPRTVRGRVLETVRRYPGSTAAELTKKIEYLSGASVSSRLSELLKQGEVSAEGRPKRYHTNT